MASSLSPTERTLRARMAAHALHSQVDSRDHLAPARAASPGNIAYFFDRVDPDRVLSESERLRRADQAKRAYFARLALASAKARRTKRARTP